MTPERLSELEQKHSAGAFLGRKDFAELIAEVRRLTAMYQAVAQTLEVVMPPSPQRERPSFAYECSGCGQTAMYASDIQHKNGCHWRLCVEALDFGPEPD